MMEMVSAIRAGGNPDLLILATKIKSSKLSCRRDLRADVTYLAISRMERLEGTAQYTLAQAEAIDAVKVALKCSPRNGEAWMQLAFLTMSQQKAVTTEVLVMLSLSQRQTPVDGSVLERRLNRLAFAYSKGADVLQPFLLRDMQSAKAAGKIQWIRKALNDLPEKVRSNLLRQADIYLGALP